MMNSASHPHPSLPGIFQLPLKLLPGRIQHPAISRILNALFAEALADNELSFLENKTININIEDSALHFCLYLKRSKLMVAPPTARPDLSISGKTYAFLLLGTRKEDADTLFFRRQLKSEGDTELGLFVKNFLDGLEPETLPAHRIMDTCMNQAIQFADLTPALVDRLPGRLQQVLGLKPNQQR